MSCLYAKFKENPCVGTDVSIPLQRALTTKSAKAITKIKKYTFINFHQVIYALPSISCLILELLAVMVFEISYFLSKFAKDNNSNKI